MTSLCAKFQFFSIHKKKFIHEKLPMYVSTTKILFTHLWLDSSPIFAQIDRAIVLISFDQTGV